MIRYIVNHFSFWTILAATLCLFLLCTYAASFLASYYWPEKTSNKTRWDFVNSVLGIACSGFFILIIFTTLNAWTYMQSAREACSREAASLIGLIRTMSYFPKDLAGANAVVTAAENYTIILRTNAWEALSVGEESPKTTQAMTILMQSIKNFHPAENAFNVAYYNQILSYMHQINENRHLRLVKANSVVPIELQDSTTIGCFLLVILLGALCRTRDTMKLLPILFFDVVLAFNIVLCVCMSFPFSGLGITNNAYYSGILKEIPDKPFL